jgi:hypothetical protein
VTMRDDRPDISVVLSPRPLWLDAAGFVLESLGFIRIEQVLDPRAAQGRVVVAPLAALERIDTSRHDLVLLEAEPTQEMPTGRTPLAPIAALRTSLEPLIGTYSSLDNYNGMRGITDDLAVPSPTWHERRVSRPIQTAASIPADERWGHRPVDGEPLVRDAMGQTIVGAIGNVVTLGVPLISYIAARSVCPPLPAHRYRFCDAVEHLGELIAAIIVSRCGPGLIRVRPWPGDAELCVTLRHDLDRPTDLIRLADRECALGYACSAYALPDACPEAAQLSAIIKRGGEIGIHTTRLDRVVEHSALIAASSGEPVVGCAAHGGDGDGWQGLPNILAAHRAGFLYTELLSEMRLRPHRIPDPTLPRASLRPLALPHHLSFDVSRGSNDGARLLSEIPRLRSARAYLTVMNHPDMNVEELLELLAAQLRPDSTTLVHTAKAACTWWVSTHVAGCLNIRTDLADGILSVTGEVHSGQLGLVFDLNAPPTCRTVGVPDHCEVTLSGTSRGLQPGVTVRVTRRNPGAFGLRLVNHE